MHLPWKHIWLTLAAFALIWLALVAVGAYPPEAFREMIIRSVGKPAAWRETLFQMTPLLATGLAVFVALRAGLFNIGAEGQLMVGSLASVAVALAIPSAFGMILAIVAGIVAGALWALPAGLIKAYRGGHEVISTIMLNSIGMALAGWLLAGPMRNKLQESTTTAAIDEAAYIPHVVDQMPFRMNLSLIIVTLITVGFAYWLKRSVKGYELSLVGKNPIAAKFSGAALKKVTVWSMTASGALAGLGGALMVLGDEHRVYMGFSGGYGFDGLGVAMLAGGSPIAVVPSAFLFAVISQGSDSLAQIQIPKGLNGVLLGLIIIVFAAYRAKKETHHD
jgi:simple sugar transport system permease protein